MGHVRIVRRQLARGFGEFARSWHVLTRRMETRQIHQRGRIFGTCLQGDIPGINGPFQGTALLVQGRRPGEGDGVRPSPHQRFLQVRRRSRPGLLEVVLIEERHLVYEVFEAQFFKKLKT
jgi:hypothetical protein